MGEEEIRLLRVTNQHLEQEAMTLQLVNQRLEKHTMNLRQNIEGGKRHWKSLRKDVGYDIKAVREEDIKKYEVAMNDLKTRLQVELNRALETQKGQLEKNFRSELMKLVHKKDNQLHLLFTHTQMVKREADKKRVAERKHYEDSYQVYLDKLKQNFQKQLTRLLMELKSKERLIDSLQRNVMSLSSSMTMNQQHPPPPHSLKNPNKHTAKSISRSKSYRKSRASQHPYNSESKRRHETMREIGGTQTVDSQPFYYLHHQYGSSALETLPERDSEDECSETEDISENGHPVTTSCSSQASEEILGHGSALETTSNCDSSQALSRQGSEDERVKIVSLEAIICQLRDELRECKDQNELLEFRLLEIEEFGPSGTQVGSSTRSKVAQNSQEENSGLDVASYVAEVPTDVTAQADYESSNSHASVAESRSSCSDCSESLSLQESGIFDSQSHEDSYSVTGCQSDISRELVTLTSQIEGLVLRFSEGSSRPGDTKPEESFKVDSSSRIKYKVRTSQDLASELQSCRQRIQDFERRLNQFTDIRYIYTLEDKVNTLIRDNQRLQEERAELEESENDTRHQCQRLEEKMVHLRQKKAILYNQLSNEKRFIEQLRMKILQLQEREEDLCSQISRIEALVQSYEQRNFELEESCIEMKCSVQFVVHSIPIFVLCYLWSLLRNLEVESQGAHLSIAFPSNKLNLLPIISSFSLCPNSLSRKHKLSEIPSPEPTVKKLRCVEDDDDEEETFHSCAFCNNQQQQSGSKDAVTEIMDVDCQTGDELWKNFVEQLLSIQRKEWKKVEKFLRKKIEFLECDIDKYHEIFDQERSKLIDNYESQLAEKENLLKENQECLSEHKILQNKWDNLVTELEQFALYLGRNLTLPDGTSLSTVANDGAEVFSLCDVSPDSPTPNSSPLPSAIEKSKELLFPSSTSVSLASEILRENLKAHPETSVEGDGGHTNELISKLLQGFCEQWTQLETREKHLLDENERLKTEISEGPVNGAKGRDADKTLIGYLTQDNNRLQTLLADQEKVWGKVKELEEDNEKLRTELGSTNVSLRKRLDETQSAEKEMRNRIEELEQSESHWKEMTSQMEKKDKKALERIQQLREEIQFLRNKCCQLQDELDIKLGRENKYKNEIQLISNKLKASALELEEKESHLENCQASSQAQISKLRAQLNEVHQQFTDAECSNGMLREEIIYLERTVQDAIEKANTHENMVQVLSSELQQKEAAIDELRQQLRPCSKTSDVGDTTPSNDLDVFAKNEGGLCGVARDVEEVVQRLQRCNRCEGASEKLTEVSKQLNVLTVMLRSSQDMRCTVRGIEQEMPNLLLRCESEEHLTMASRESKETQVELGCPAECQKENKTMTGHISHLEDELQERDAQIETLQQTMCRLSIQISHLEEMFHARQKELRESHLNESSWWKWRCAEKNHLIELLARRIAHLSVTDINGYFVDGILREIQCLRDHSYPTATSATINTTPKFNVDSDPILPDDFYCDTLCTFLQVERNRVMDLLEGACEGNESLLDAAAFLVDNREQDFTVDFRVLRRIGEDALLVSWTMPEKYTTDEVNGYEISVNGSIFLKIPKPNRYKAVLFGLNMNEPLRLSLKCTGAYKLQESTITYIA